MAPPRAKRDSRKVGRQTSVLRSEGKQPQGIKKKQRQLPPRKSARQEEIRHRREQTAPNDTPHHLTAAIVPSKEACYSSPQHQYQQRKRKRPQEPRELSISPPTKRLRKRQRTYGATSVGNTLSQPAAGGFAGNNTSPVVHWIQEATWPGECFDQDDRTRKDFEKDSWFEEYWVPEMSMNHLFARKKSSSSLRGKQSTAGSVVQSSTTPSDQKPREIKSAPYQDARYESILAAHGSFMGRSELGVKDTSKIDCRTLLEAEQTYPNDSLFCDDLFEEVCEMVRNKNEARIVRDISPLIVPSAETLAVRGARRLKILIESVNEGWNNSIPVTKTRPQPDYSVGFRREAFTEDQLKRLEPFLGDLTDTSFFMATYYMYFPFLTCEVKCGAAALDVADRQNAHSMTLAVRGIVELFRLVKRESEIHQQILAFSISHDHTSVRIYGHYPLIDGKTTAFYRHAIHKFDFTSLEGKEKWTAYKFTRNVYDIWMPTHFKRICSVIDELPPDVNFGVSQESELGESGLSQGLESHHLSDYSSHDAASLLEETGSQSSRVSSRDVTPDTSLSQRMGRASKKLKKRARPEELHQ